MSFRINKVYNFNTLAPNILGSYYSLMKVKSILSADKAAKIEDVYNLNSKLVSVIPGLSNDPSDNEYILFENSDGTERIFAYEWLNEETITEATNTNIKVTIANRDTTDVAVIKQALIALGYTNLEITTY